MFGNWFKTSLLMAAIMALFGMVGALLGGGQGMLLALAFGLATNLWAYWFSDTMVLKLYRAREVDATSAPQLYATVKDLAGGAGLPMPRVYIADNPQPNAFATGRSPEHAAVCATTGILQRLNQEELAGVLAHELSHVKNRDTLIMTITATIAGAISMLAQSLYPARPTSIQLAFNVCAGALSTAFAFLIYHYPLANQFIESRPLLLCVAATTYFIVNAGSIAVALKRKTGPSLGERAAARAARAR